MAIPLTVQLLDAFLGTAEGIHSIILPDIFSSGGSKNVWIDKFGRVAEINGYAKQNASAMTTDTGASAAMVRGLIPYKATGGGTTARKLIVVIDDQVNEWEIWVSTDNGANSTFLYDAGSTAVGQIPDAAQFGDDLYITNGKTVPRLYDGTSISAVGLTQSPTPASAASATSGVLRGNYRYKLVSTIGGVRQAGSASSTSLLVSDKQVDLTWTADTNVLVDGYEIYRTTGTGTTFYYLQTISGRLTASYTDNLGDTSLLEQRVMEEHGDNPPTAYWCEPHKQRMWWLRTDTYPTRGYWSDPGAPESVYNNNYLDFSDSETIGDVITGAIGNYEGLLIVLTEQAIWSVSGTGAIIGDITDWTKTRTNAQVGCVGSRSVARVPAGSKFVDQTGQLQTTAVSSLAYFCPDGTIRLFDGDNDLVISYPVKESLAAYSYEHRKKVFVLDDLHNKQVIWFYPGANSGEPNEAVCWNYQYGVWYKWTPMPFGHACMVDTATDPHVILTGESAVSKGAYVYEFFTGNDFDGENINSRWMTKTLYGVNEQGQPAMSNTKRWRWLDLLFKTTAAVDINVEWLPGFSTDDASASGSVVISPAASALFTMDDSEILTADGSGISVAAATAQAKALLRNTGAGYLHDEGIRLRVGTNDTAGAWTLEAMQIAYQVMPGLRRRSG
jgi:hypothetical protein